LEKGVDIVVATPGRLMDHMQRRTIDLSEIQFLVLDEADRMLDMGFIEDIDYILSKLPKQRQSMLFSATIPETVRKIAGEHMIDPIRVIISEDKLVLPSTRQIYFNIERKNKIWALCRVLDKYQPKAMVFAQTKMMVNTIERVLKSYGYPVASLHGDLTQSRREKVLTDFRAGKIQVLVATDVAARGLDIEDVTHVINFDIPEDPEVYVHRIGRTGRAGKEGVAITFITAREMYLLKKIKEFGVVEMLEEAVPESGQKDVVRRVVDFEAYSDIFGMVKFRISLGEKDHIRSIDIVDILSRRLKVNEMSIGNIEIHDDYTEVEVHKDAAGKALAGLRAMDIDGKKLHVDMVPVKNF
jgi:ATP-dependent RNA helicase DeaD